MSTIAWLIACAVWCFAGWAWRGNYEKWQSLKRAREMGEIWERYKAQK